jgi:hypothetical protein
MATMLTRLRTRAVPLVLVQMVQTVLAAALLMSIKEEAYTLTRMLIEAARARPRHKVKAAL